LRRSRAPRRARRCAPAAGVPRTCLLIMPAPPEENGTSMTGSSIRTSRRALLRVGGLALGAAALAACGQPLPTPVIPTQPPAKPTEAPKPAGEATKPAAAVGTPAAAATTAPAAQPTTAPSAAQPATGGTAQI